MTSTSDIKNLSGAAIPRSKFNGTGLFYYLLFVMQTIGAIVFYWICIPLYRRLMLEPSRQEGKEILLWSLLAIVLMQATYWFRYRMVPELPRILPSAAFGHVVLFLGQLVFNVAIIFFSFAFIAYPPELQRPLFNYAVTIVGIFSLYCYSLELERLGKAFMGKV
ncbi:MAG: hypothetical protein WBR29_12470 [Gammaproteobacteria bacterium]